MTLMKQIWTMSAIYLNYFSTGLMWDTSDLEDFKSGKDSSSISWDGIFSIIGYGMSSYCMDKIGRRYTYIMGIIPGLLSCALINFRITTEMDITRKILSSFSYGVTNILGIIIIGEYTSPKHRGVFLNLVTTSMYFGYVVRQILKGFQLSTLVNVSLILQFLSLAIVLTWPESPYWLVLKKRYQECEESFAQLRGFGEDAIEEKNYMLSRKHRIIRPATVVENVVSVCRTCASRAFRRPATTVVFGVLLAEASGRHYLPIFASYFFTTLMVETPSQRLYISILIALSSSISLVLLTVFRNRKLLLITGSSVILFVFFGSIYAFLLNYEVISTNSSWIGILLIILHIICCNFGATSIPLALIGEVFPLDNKAIGSFVSGVVTSAFSWTSIKMAACLLMNVRLFGTLAIFGMMMTISLLFLCVILPETKRRTLQEIEEYFICGWFDEDVCDEEMRLAVP